MRIKHGRVCLELHEVAQRPGPNLLLLHALYGSSQDWNPPAINWRGSVYALDFSGHGQSDWVAGGGYYPELLLADADAALARIGRTAVAGAGIGAYIALLLAGARRDLVPAALLRPGAGLAGGGALPDFDRELPDFLARPDGAAADPPYDPMVRALDIDARPVDYAASFAGAVQRLLLCEDATPRPPWWEVTRESPTAERVPADTRAALGRLAQVVD